jgi:hypothetical protein
MKNQIIDFILKEAKIAERILTAVQKQIIDICEPMIEELCDKAEKQIEQIIQRIENDKIKYNIELLYNISKGFSISLDEIYKKGSDEREILNRLYEFPEPYKSTKLENFKLNKSRKDRYIEQTKLDIREFNLRKLREAIIKYISPDFVKVDGKLRQGTKGFEFSGELIDNLNRKWNFTTRAISAGGFNIQTFHYRYIINLSSPEVPKEFVKQRITQEQKTEKENKQKEKLLLRQNKEKDSEIKKKISAIRSFGSDYKRALDIVNYSKPFLAMSDDEIRNWILTAEFGMTHFVQGDDKQLLTKSIEAVRDFFKKRIDKKTKDLEDMKETYEKFYDSKGKSKYSKEQLYEIFSDSNITINEFNPF